MSDFRGTNLRRSENPLRLSFWLGDVDPRPGAIFRIALGLSVLHYLAGLSPDVIAFLSDDGILPRAGLHFLPGVFNFVGDPWSVAAVYAAGVLTVGAFTLGYHTRLATIASWIFMTSIVRRNHFISDGGDELVLNLFFLSMFTDLGRAFSFDVALGRKKVSPAPALGVRFLGVHVALLYFLTGVMKARAGWFSGNPIHDGLQLTGFVRPPGAILFEYPDVCRFFALVTVTLELAFAPLAFSPFYVSFCRGLAVAAGTAVQLGILITMRVGVFTEATLTAALILVQPEWLDWLAARWRRARFVAPAMSPPPNRTGGLANLYGSASIATFAFLLVHSFAFLTSGPFAGRVPGSDTLAAERRMLTLGQSTNLFTDHDSIPVWKSPGRTVNGDSVDVLPATEPGIVPTGPAWRMSRWYKLNFHTANRGFPFQGIGRILCRDYKERTGVALQSFSIIETLTPPRQANEPAQPPILGHSFQMTCP